MRCRKVGMRAVFQVRMCFVNLIAKIIKVSPSDECCRNDGEADIGAVDLVGVT